MKKRYTTRQRLDAAHINALFASSQSTMRVENDFDDDTNELAWLAYCALPLEPEWSRQCVADIRSGFAEAECRLREGWLP